MIFQPSKCRSIVLIAFLAWSNLVLSGEINVEAQNNRWGKVMALLKANPDLVNSKDNLGATPLFWAAAYNNKGMVELLLASNADVNAKDNRGYAPLRTAVENDNTNMVELLLANKADVATRDNYGETPLVVAAAGDHVGVAKILLANKADVNSRDIWGRTPLQVVAWNGHKDMVELLLASNADVNATTTDGHNGTPLSAALGMDHEDVAEVLLQHGGHGPKCTAKPFVGWYSDGDIRFHLVKIVTDDYQEFITKNKLVMANGFDVYYENKTGKYAVTFEAFPPNQNATWRYALIYDKNNKRIKVVKYDYHRYQS